MIDKDKYKFVHLDELVYDYQNSDYDIYEILLNEPYKFTLSEVRKRVRYYRLEQYIEDLERWAKEGFLTQYDCNNIIDGFIEYYNKKQYEMIKDVYNIIYYTVLEDISIKEMA